MAFRYRDEIVGKRFLSVSGFTKLKLSKISEWGWRAGVVRAASHKDNKHKDLQVLVEYDDTEWQRREWISVYKDNIFQVFMVESSLVWCDRKDPYTSLKSSVLWPALTFTSLVATMDLSSQRLQPVEFLVDQELAFKDPTTLLPYKEWDLKIRGVKDYPAVREAARRWVEAQDGQQILLTTPSVLVGFRVEVYRAEGTTQWYTAVICGYNEATHELTVTDDTVLEGHNEDPTLVQMRLIGDRVVESIMRGEDVGITPRRSRSSNTPAPPPALTTPSRSQRQLPVSVVQTDAPVACPSRKHLRREAARPPDNFKDKPDSKKKPRTRRRNNGVKPITRSKEDLENKGKKKRSVEPRPAKKKVLEEANNSKLRRLVEVRVEDCLRRVNKELSGVVASEVVQEDKAGESEREEVVVAEDEEVADECPTESASVVEERVTETEPTAEVDADSERTERVDDDGPTMELAGDSTPAVLRFSDDRSDSGVSSLRSAGSGDERSGSRSSALSSSDEPRSGGSGKSSSPVVWREPADVRHVHSVQHQSLLMSHPGGSAPPAPPPASHYPPPLMAPHPLHHLQAPGSHLYPPHVDMLWKPRYHHPQSQLSHHPTAEELQEQRERAYAQDRHDRLIRDRREQERELEKQKEREREREREIKTERDKQERDRIERERLEKQRAEQAVHKHFEESLRLAQAKRSAKVEYPPPAHRPVGGVKDKSSVTSGLPKAEPNLTNLFYSGYQPPLAFIHHDPSKVKSELKASQSPSLVVTKSSPADREMGLPNPPPLMSDLKNSVIVENKIPKTMDKTKLRVSEPHYLPSAPSGGAQMKYEYRSPSQSPHLLSHQSHHFDQAANLASISKVHNHNSAPVLHQRARQSPLPPHRQSPHPPHRQSPHQPSLPHRQSPHPHPQRQSPHPHPHASSPDQRYPPGTLIYSKSATVNSYPYPAPAPPPLHYAAPVTTPPKPKVSSPAPPHIYGKPSSGISAGTPICRAQEMRLSPLPLTSTKAPLTTSPYQQMPQHHPPSQHHPPPQHQGGPLRDNLHQPPPPAHSSRGVYGMYQPPQGPGLAVSVKPPPSSPPSRSSPLAAFQTQPLDLGVKEDQDRGASPKRKLADDPECLDAKKRRNEEPVLSRVSEPSPLLASAATTITTVVNTAVTDSLDRPSSAGTPAPPACPSPNTPAKPPSGVDSEKSNSPGPPPRTTSSYPVHKLKKAWLQRHSGEDGTDDKDIVGSGSCVTLPITLPKKEERTECVSAVNSLHSIGSMAVNSISKTKPKNGRKTAKDSPLLNGHTSGKLPDADDSSSSDPDRKASPPKRVPPKVKRKKGGRKPVVEENKRKKLSASSTDSGKESESDKESDTGSGKKAAGDKSEKTAKDSGKKRGRRPKTNQSTLPKNEGGEESRPKKPRDEPPTPPQRDPFAKPPVGQLKKTGESFLQDGPCFEVAPKLAKCRECRWTPHQRSRNQPNIFCRFYAFRRLRYTKNGQLAIAGFSDPNRDATPDDLKLWLPQPEHPPPDLDMDMSRFLLHQVGDQFCDLLQQEKEAISIHMSEDKTIAWKRVVQGVREMCDVCETTLFNFHWACGKCGFVVCIDCYKSRKQGTVKMWGEPGRDRDDKSWLLCTNRQGHEQEKLMLTQIIAGDSLHQLGRKAHEARATWGIPMHCGCPLASASTVKPTNGFCKDILKSIQLKTEPVNGQIKTEKEEKTDEKNSPLNWLADVALSNEDKKNSCGESACSSDSDDDKDGNYSTLRELLIRPGPKSNGSRAASPTSNNTLPTTNNSSKSKKSHVDTLNEVISSVIEHSVNKTEEDTATDKVATPQLKHFVRRYTWPQKSWRDPVPIRIMTLTESEDLYPDLPHSWLCEGRLLRLLDPNHSGNYRIFQDQWKRGQPVIVSDVLKHLDKELWQPDSFIRDFGETKNDLINCMTGNVVPNQFMRKFWEGFDHVNKRLKDDKGNAMLLKLKDWPPGEDFAEMLPSRFTDLMKALPMGEYTQRTGRLNLASRLPDCFVRPDLGPKMYTAYGSALHPTKGTTNLHLDISDAVNVMVYVGIPKDAESDDHIKEAYRAIDEACSDLLTRRRVRDKSELPGALWHIYSARDADKIRDLLNKVAIERGARLEPHHDPIHDQSWYLDAPLRERLYKEYAVEGYAIVQCLGDAIFIPAGAPHQVRNLHNCIKVAEDFVSPENVSHCFHLTQEFRELSDTHTNHEDKLQIKNIIYHAVKDSLSILTTKENYKQEMKIENADS
ncbi:lysine-specific demethylase 3A-like isoform X2 [Macrosteles quadrilineatus]|uniref:lysine-specific demethylase 3A-like isoform X2 n=1 Tax=Macrosteles quadrilineatus TaxID=74068 RepID=UPI0023E1CC79|nr:lysine-specific demethylase 3A-like isoform X2 [Macrosteles quadrilineatus]